MEIRIQRSFSDRESLDAFVRSHFGEDPTKNKEITIEASEEDLTKLSLSENSTVYGVRVKKTK